MSFRKKLSYSLITSLIFILVGCDRQTDTHIVDELKLQQQRQQKKIEQLEQLQLTLAKNEQRVAMVINEIATRQQALTYTELDPSQTRYFMLNTHAIGLAGKILSVAPINDGSVIHISLVNLSSIPLTNIGFQMAWGNAKPKDEKDLARWNQLLFSTSLDSDIELLPGQWKDINLSLKGVSPNNLKYLKMSLNMDNIIFGSAPSQKVEVKKNKR